MDMSMMKIVIIKASLLFAKAVRSYQILIMDRVSISQEVCTYLEFSLLFDEEIILYIQMLFGF